MAYIPTNSISKEFKKDEWGLFVDENPNWAETIQDLAQDGDGEVAWKVYLGLNNAKFKRFLNIPEFYEEVEKAKMLEYLYWQREGRRMVSGDTNKYPGAGRGNSQVYRLIMKNKFGWENSDDSFKTIYTASQPDVDKIESDVVEFTPEELEQELAARGLPTVVLQEYIPEPIQYSEEEIENAEYSEIDERNDDRAN